MDNAQDAALWWLESYGATAAETERRHVWVWAEAPHGRLAESSRQLIGKARELAAVLGVRVEAVLIGRHADNLADELFALGADVAYLAEDLAPDGYPVLRYATCLASLVRAKRPEALLLAETDLGRDLAPRLAQRLGVGLVTDCVDLAVDAGERRLVATRYGFAGRSLVSAVFPTSWPQMVTVRSGAFRAPTPEVGRAGRIERVELQAEPDATSVRFVESRPASEAGPDLPAAGIIVAGGEGMGGAASFAHLEELARRLGGAVGASRLAVDRGWAPADQLIDYLGRHVRPDLYIACGVREGGEHLAAIRQARLVVAIGRDASAPILSMADYRILADPVAVVEALNAALRATEGAAGSGEADGRENGT